MSLKIICEWAVHEVHLKVDSTQLCFSGNDYNYGEFIWNSCWVLYLLRITFQHEPAATSQTELYFVYIVHFPSLILSISFP